MASIINYPKPDFSVIFNKFDTAMVCDVLHNAFSFRDIQTNATENFIEIRCFGKSFWQRKEWLYIKIEPIDDLTYDNKSDDTVQEYEDKYIGIEIKSKFSSYTIDSKFIYIHKIGKFILNYGLVNSALWAGQEVQMSGALNAGSSLDSSPLKTLGNISAVKRLLADMVCNGS